MQAHLNVAGVGGALPLAEAVDVGVFLYFSHARCFSVEGKERTTKRRCGGERRSTQEGGLSDRTKVLAQTHTHTNSLERCDAIDDVMLSMTRTKKE